MKDKKFLVYMESPNRANNNLMHWDRKHPREPKGLVVKDMKLFQKYEILFQVMHAMEYATAMWTFANGGSPGESEMHWPSVHDLELDNNGSVMVFPETLVNSVPQKSHKFQSLVKEILGVEFRDLTIGNTEFLFSRAGIDFCGNAKIGLEWLKRLPGTMSATLEEVCGVMERDHKTPPECTRAVLQLMTKENRTVTLNKFCESTRVFGIWWMGDMLQRIKEVVRERTHFYIATSQQASVSVHQEGLGYIIRPRLYYDETSRGALWPFALTLLVRGSVEQYVVSFARGMFEVKDENGVLTRDPSIVHLAYLFAKSKGVVFVE